VIEFLKKIWAEINYQTPPCSRCGEEEFTDEIIDTDGGLQLGCIPIYARHKCAQDNLGENI